MENDTIASTSFRAPETETPQPPAITATTVTENTANTVTDELLVEEISIDGMCGVY